MVLHVEVCLTLAEKPVMSCSLLAAEEQKQILFSVVDSEPEIERDTQTEYH